jgi:Family of unknown function (DUF6510)
MNPASLDGNAAAGDLADVFAFDVTTAVVTCAACHHTQAVATLHAYLQAPGMVLRCSSCDAVQVRFVRAAERAWLDLRGINMLEVQLPTDG